MRKRNGYYTCALCEVPLDIPEGRQPQVMIESRPDERVRVLMLDGLEIHRCPIPTNE